MLPYQRFYPLLVLGVERVAGVVLVPEQEALVQKAGDDVIPDHAQVILGVLEVVVDVVLVLVHPSPAAAALQLPQQP